MAARIQIFHRPARTVEGSVKDAWGDWMDADVRLPELTVVFEKQSAWWPWGTRAVQGRARVIDLYTLLVDGVPRAHGPRAFAMQEAHRWASLDADGELPYWMRDGLTKRESARRLRATQRHNDRRWHRKSNRKRRKAGRRWMKRFVLPKMIDATLRHVFRDALFPKLLLRDGMTVVEVAT